MNPLAEQQSFLKPDKDLLAALTGHDAVADRALSLRTRRAVYKASLAQHASQSQGRRSLALAFLVTGGLTLALAPVLWAGMDDMLGGETLFDLPGMLVALGVVLFAAVAAVLALLGGEKSSRISRAPKR